MEVVGELVAVFGKDNSFHWRAQNFYFIFFQHAGFVQGNAAVKRGLPAKGKQNRVRPFFCNYPFHKFERDRQKINAVSQIFGSLDGRDVGVNKHSLNSLFL